METTLLNTPVLAEKHPEDSRKSTNRKASHVVRLWSRRVPTIQPTATQKKPKHEWPLWAKALSLLKSEQDKGLGDTIERIIGKEKSEAYQKWYKATFGKSCGCSGRKNNWNIQYSYKN